MDTIVCGISVRPTGLIVHAIGSSCDVEVAAATLTRFTPGDLWPGVFYSYRRIPRQLCYGDMDERILLAT